jgi:1,4-alpha-glucan branching enzyme
MTGKKLLFMGGEIAQRQEWRHDASIDWHLLQYTPHKGMQNLVRDLNRLYQTEPALHELDSQPGGFEWIDCTDANSSTMSYIRRSKTTDDIILVVLNFTPVPRDGYRIGVPGPGFWKEILNTDSGNYYGTNIGNNGGLYAEFVPFHNQKYSLQMNLPPLAAVFFKGRY